MADDKKNIGPEVEKTDTAPAPEQPAPDMAEPVVADPAPAEKAALEPHKPNKEAKQTDTPDKGNPAPAPAGKVVDFAAAREEAGKDKAPKQKAPKQKPRSRRTKQRPRPARAARQRLTRRPPTRPSRPRGTKCPKVIRLLGKELPPRMKPRLRRNSPPRPVTLLAQKKRKLSTSICPSYARSKTIPLVSVTMPRCRALWSPSGQAA